MSFNLAELISVNIISVDIQDHFLYRSLRSILILTNLGTFVFFTFLVKAFNTKLSRGGEQTSKESNHLLLSMTLPLRVFF